MGFVRGCSHGYQPNRCVVDPNCPHADQRPLCEQLFGRDSNSELAAKLYRTNKPLYDSTKAIAIEHGLLPKNTIPKCLRDE